MTDQPLAFITGADWGVPTGRYEPPSSREMPKVSCCVISDLYRGFTVRSKRKWMITLSASLSSSDLKGSATREDNLGTSRSISLILKSGECHTDNFLPCSIVRAGPAFQFDS